jgi:OOP family OmpA-OmpF porin
MYYYSLNTNGEMMLKILLVLLFNITITFSATDIHVNNNDKDNDLVPDTIDECLNTPDGVFVNKHGCTHKIKKNIYFKHASYDIDTREKEKIDEISELAKEGFGYKILIEGHTDSISDAKYNLKLSKHRALKIKKLLIKSKIDKKRIYIKWYGETMPISSNISEKNRALNRRVKITFY